MTVLIVIEIIIAILLVVLILLQNSDNEGLGFGGGGGLGGLMTARGSANFLSRATAIVASLFMIMSVIMTVVASTNNEKKILESLPSLEQSTEGNKATIIEEPTIPDSN